MTSSGNCKWEKFFRNHLKRLFLNPFYSHVADNTISVDRLSIYSLVFDCWLNIWTNLWNEIKIVFDSIGIFQKKCRHPTTDWSVLITASQRSCICLFTGWGCPRDHSSKCIGTPGPIPSTHVDICTLGDTPPCSQSTWHQYSPRPVHTCSLCCPDICRQAGGWQSTEMPSG